MGDHIVSHGDQKNRRISIGGALGVRCVEPLVPFHPETHSGDLIDHLALLIISGEGSLRAIESAVHFLSEITQKSTAGESESKNHDHDDRFEILLHRFNPFDWA